MKYMIYDRPDRPSPYGIKWTDEKGKRKFQFYKTMVLRDEELLALNRHHKKTGSALLNLSGTDANIMIRCIEMLGSSDKVLIACEEYASKTDLIECVYEKAIDEYIKEKRALDRDDAYCRRLENNLKDMKEYFPKHLFNWDIETARNCFFSLSAKFAPVTVKTRIKDLRAFSNWATERKYLPENIFNKIPIPKATTREPGFLIIENIKKLFDKAVEYYPEAVAYLALGAFAGIRSSACARLEFESIDFKKKGILIKAEHAKNNRRIYIDGHEPNLWLWLNWAKKHAPNGFNITKKRWDTIRLQVVEKAKVKMPHNALRHSFCTYHVALYGDAGKTATLLTHRGNVSILYEHYKGNASKAEGEEYFSITPTTTT